MQARGATRERLKRGGCHEGTLEAEQERGARRKRVNAGRPLWSAVVLSILLVPALARAGPIEKLRAFISETRSAKATFTQTVVDSGGVVQQESSGSVQFQRPGKFRWTYAKPYEQLIVGDGEYLWIYDKDLNQVTRRTLGKALGSSPAALLAGADDVDRHFSLNAIGMKKSLDWLEARPYEEDSLFEKVLMGFRGNALEVMELHDHFGQKTTIRFSALQRNPKTGGDAYRFSVPAGADLVTE
jgi:outer membrane lipoprotein carrier protein